MGVVIWIKKSYGRGHMDKEIFMGVVIWIKKSYGCGHTDKRVWLTYLHIRYPVRLIPCVQ